MGNDENWIRNLREAGRGYEVAPVQGLWEELEEELLAARVARRPVWAPKIWYAAAGMVVAAVVSIYIICGRHNPDIATPVLTIYASESSVEDNATSLNDEEAMPLLAKNEKEEKGASMVSSSEDRTSSSAQKEIEGYGEFSYYERIIVVEDKPDPMNNDYMMVSASTDMKSSDNTYNAKDSHHRSVGGRLYASASGAKLSGGTPVSAGATLVIPLADKLRLETGLEYTGVRAGGATDSYIGVPVKVSYDLYDSNRMRVYASAGGAVDKSLDRRNVNVSLNAGVGLEYDIDDDWGVFIEPGVEYRPGNGGCVSTVYGDRHVGPEVRVGFRHTFR